MIQGVTKTIINQTKEQQCGFFGMLLDALGASLLGTKWAGAGIIRVIEGVIKAGQ